MRWYDPETGRWLSKDPIGLSGGLNLYAFCGNDAIDNSDYEGTVVIAVGGGGAAGAGAAIAGDSGIVVGFSFKKGLQFGTYQTGGVGYHVGIDASFGTVITFAPFAGDICDIAGLSFSAGGSLGIGPSLSGEISIPIGTSLKGTALSVSGGAGVGGEVHGITSGTMVQRIW